VGMRIPYVESNYAFKHKNGSNCVHLNIKMVATECVSESIKMMATVWNCLCA
jgi:hypothetical protein